MAEFMPWVFVRALWRHVEPVMTAVSSCPQVSDSLSITPVARFHGRSIGIVAGLFIVVCYRAWRDEHRKRVELEAAIAPKLSMHYEVGVPPFFQNPGDGNYFRVAVRNDSAAEVTNIRVVLESCNHPADKGINLGQRLQVIGAPHGTDSTAIAANTTGSMFDVVGEVNWIGRPIAVRIWYAADSAYNEIDREIVWRIVLRAEGAGPVARRAFIVRENETTKRIEMLPTVD